jgi:hypothetical protein
MNKSSNKSEIFVASECFNIWFVPILHPIVHVLKHTYGLVAFASTR